MSPSVTATISGPSAQSRDQRKAGKEPKNQEKALERQQKKERHEQGQARPNEAPASATTPLTPSNSSSVSPSATGSPFLFDARELRKQEKKQQKREREGAGEPTEGVSPSPSMTPLGNRAISSLKASRASPTRLLRRAAASCKSSSSSPSRGS